MNRKTPFLEKRDGVFHLRRSSGLLSGLFWLDQGRIMLVQEGFIKELKDPLRKRIG